MLKRIALFICVAAIFSGCMLFEDPIGFRGEVLDVYTGEPLAEVRIEVEGNTIYTDSNGKFELLLPDNPDYVVYSLYKDGYDPIENDTADVSNPTRIYTLFMYPVD